VSDFIVFEGTLKELCNKVDSGELIPKLQASHAPPCKFWTAYAVINGIKHCVPLIHGPTGCTYSVSSEYKMFACNYKGCPVEPTSCTALDETCIVFGGESKLFEAAREAKKKFNPDILVILSCCCSGIIGDDVEAVASRVEKEINTPVIAIRSEGFGGDFRSGHEEAFKAIVSLMESQETKKNTINIVGARIGPTNTEWPQEIDELQRLVEALGITVNAIIAGGCTLEEIRRAPSVELNASWCYDWGQKIGILMEEQFGVPFSKTGLPYGHLATREWILSIAEPMGLQDQALELIGDEERNVKPDIEKTQKVLEGKTALIEIAEYPGPMRALALARMVEEYGGNPVVINLHPYTVKERRPAIDFLLQQGENPNIILTKGLFDIGSFRSSHKTEEEIEYIADQYKDSIFFANPLRFPSLPVVNLRTIVSGPQFGYAGVKNIAYAVERAVDYRTVKRSRLFKEVLYGHRLHR
jgi:nitrogenase molybdenum-iron protein alpha/beta subunit